MPRVRDMTTGNPLKHIVQFALPLLLGNLFQQFYNLIDSIVVGQKVGKNALAAVGACGSLNFLFFSLNLGLGTGIGVLTAQYFGAGNEKKVKSTISNAIYVLGISSIVVSLIGILFAPNILSMLNTPEAIIHDSTVYLRTTCAGIIAVAAYNGMASILRALGDSRTPLIFLIISSIINVSLDLLFVMQFDMGVLGVAVATIIAQATSAITCLIYALKKIPFFQLSREEMKPDFDIITRALKIGTPIALQQSLIAISCIVLQRVVNGFGETVVATFTITSRVEQIIQQPYSSLGMALTTYSGQNMGAGKIDRVRKGMKLSTIIALVFSLSMLPIAYIFGESIIRIFVDNETVITMGAKALRITSLCYFPLGMIYVPRALLNGAGDAGFSMINGISEVVCRIGLSKILTQASVMGAWGIWMTSGGTWTITAVVCLIRYFSGVWKKKAVTVEQF